MATKKGSKKSGKGVDTILVLLILIIVFAIVALGIVLIISFNTPDVIVPDNNPGMVTETNGTYEKYLTTTMEENGYKSVPVSGIENVSYAVLGVDNNVYLITNGENPDEIPGASDSNKNGVKYANLSNVVDLFEISQSNGITSVFALTSEGKLYALNIADPNSEYSLTAEYGCGKEIIELYTTGDEIYAKLFDNSTIKIEEQC